MPPMKCSMGNHMLQPPKKFITEKRLLHFAQRVNPEMRSHSPLCSNCYDTMKKIYNAKLQSAIKLQKEKRHAAANTNSISDVSSSQPLVQQTLYSSSSSSSSANKRKSNETDTDDEGLGINALNGTRLPHIQPAPKRRTYVHLNKTVMDIYLAGTTGG